MGEKPVRIVQLEGHAGIGTGARCGQAAPKTGTGKLIEKLRRIAHG